jgi:hypothetical protein
MPNYQRDPDIRAVLETGFAIPDGLDAAEADRSQTFLNCDQELERFYAVSQPRQRPPRSVLEAVASAAMAAYDRRSDRLPVGWQKLLVLRAGIVGCSQNLDSSEIEEWAYTRITEENPSWLEPYDGEVENEPPLNWLRYTLEPEVLKDPPRGNERLSVALWPDHLETKQCFLDALIWRQWPVAQWWLGLHDETSLA